MTTVNLRGEPVASLPNGNRVHVAMIDPSPFLGLLTAYVSGPQRTRSAAMAIAADLCGGCTVSDARGAWDGPSGRVFEPVIRLEAAFETAEQARQLASALRENAKQGSQTHFMYSILICDDTTFAIDLSEV